MRTPAGEEDERDPADVLVNGLLSTDGGLGYWGHLECRRKLAAMGAKAVPAILRRLETEQDDFVRDAILRALKRLEG